ncbi:MAG: Uncharacterised protein [Halieaceae bacterium]|jgi:uncharacterized membrane protein YraQ (UPF0718 family)|nr:MAG: Uncharacterised protein [Halieaceae bacterium]|tara:strand:- start:181 stop:744 length:564 start_codon:yes stop_codon:yes gene_type:complete
MLEKPVTSLGRRISAADIVFVGLALTSGLLCLWLGGWDSVQLALGQAGGLLLMVIPQLGAGLLIGGLIQQLVDRDRVTKFLGAGSGARGLILSAFAGMLTPGGPFTSFPIVHALWVAGADAGALVAYVAAWSLIGLYRLIIWEIPFIGGDVSLLRFFVSLPMPLLAGFVARWLVQVTPLRPDEGPRE